ncbi:MAG: hypothetical protein SV775_09445 [Thermodesulfobacteriota bacterium]|nr:hypothetical protein [Thermodesulfobacteriota bacterium]
MTHQIAGITFRTESDIFIPPFRWDTFDQFKVTEKTPDVCIRIRRLDLDGQCMTNLSGEECALFSSFIGFQGRWLDNPILRSRPVRSRLHECLDRPDQVSFRITTRAAIIHDFFSNELDIFYDPGLEDFFDSPFLVPALKNTLASFIPSFNGVMIHGAGVLSNGSAAVFLAPDEGGKTSVVTTSNLSPVLNDDQLILRRGDDAVLSHGTPFGPITDGPRAARIGGMFLLEKGERFDLSSIKSQDTFRHLWNEHRHHCLFLPKYLKKNVFEILIDACRQAPSFRMRFPKDYVDWDAIDAAMEGTH